MASKGDKKSCCGGCGIPPRDQNSPLDAIPSMAMYCCGCIPRAICLSISSNTGDLIKIIAPIDCSPPPDDPEPVMYSVDVPINDQMMTFNFRFHIEGSPEKLCYFCLDVPGVSGSICVLVDRSYAVDFCSTFRGVWTLNTSSFGNGHYSSLSVTTSVADNVDLRQCDCLAITTDCENVFPVGPSGCNGCDCVCRCVCFTVIKLDPNDPGVSTEEVCLSEEELCVPVIPYSNSCGGVSAIASWTRTDGWTCTISDELRGGAVLSFGSFVLEKGSASGNPIDVLNCLRNQTLLLTPDISGEIDAEYWLYSDSSQPQMDLTVWAKTQDWGALVDVLAFNWATSEWGLIGTIDGTDSSAPFLPTTMVLSSDQTDNSGVSGHKGRSAFRFRSSTAARIELGVLIASVPRCCYVFLDPPAEFAFNSPPAPIPLKFPLTCPDLSLYWGLTTTQGVMYGIGVNCQNCGECAGVAAPLCCPEPIPRFLTASATLSCPNGCADFVVPLISSAGTALWDGVLQEVFCGNQIQLSFACIGEGQFSLGGQGAACSLVVLYVVSVSCNPFRVEFSVEFTGGLGCCGPSDPFLTPSGTIVVTE